MKDKSATIIIDLREKNKEEIWKGLDRSRRKNINQAAKKLSFIENFDEKDILKSYKIYSKNRKENKIDPMGYGEWKERIKSDNYDLFLVEYNNQIIGCGLIENITMRFYGLDSDEKGIRFSTFASERKFNELRPNDFLYWNAILYALNNNFNFVDLGGYQMNAREELVGVNKFKMQWGGKIFYFDKNYPFFKSIGRKLTRNSDFFWWLNKKLKRRE